MSSGSFFSKQKGKNNLLLWVSGSSSNVVPIKLRWNLSEATIWAPPDRSSSVWRVFTCSEAYTYNTQAYSIHAKENQSSILLSCDCRGQYTLINEFHYYAYVFIFLMMDLGKKKPCIFCDRAVRHHQAIKTIHHMLIYIPLSITFQNIVFID